LQNVCGLLKHLTHRKSGRNVGDGNRQLLYQ
jgi:hypothetical protein